MDLTALRQDTSFDAEVLEEFEPNFLGVGGPRISFGSDQLVFRRNGEFYRIDLANPSHAEKVVVKAISPTNAYVVANHYEQQIDEGYIPGVLNNGPLANGDGSLIAWNTQDGPGVSVWPPDKPGEAKTVTCPEAGNLAVLGWRDHTHLLLASFDIGGNYLSSGVATVSPTTGEEVRCRALIPDADRELRGSFDMGLDGAMVFFEAATPTGFEPYAVSTLGDAVSEPYPSPPFQLPGGNYVSIFFPVIP